MSRNLAAIWTSFFNRAGALYNPNWSGSPLRRGCPIPSVGITADVGLSRALLSDRQCHFYGSKGSVPEAFYTGISTVYLYHLFYATTEHHVYKSYSSC
jgi:hypothetical protein